MFNSFYSFLIINFLVCATHSQIPPIACPEYFRYSNDGVYFFGKLTIPNSGMDSIAVNVQFSQQTPLQSVKVLSLVYVFIKCIHIYYYYKKLFH